MGLMDSRNALGMASPQDQQFARRAKSAVEGSLPYQNFKQMVTGPIDQVSDIYAVLNGTGTQQEADNIVRRVGEGLIGMGGYVRTKGGGTLPHNDPKVVQAYLDNIRNRFGNSGVEIMSDIKHYPDYSNLKMDFMRDGSKIGESTRRFTPDGVNMEWLGSALPEGESMGVMPHLYPAEAQFGRVYGGELDGTFANPATHAGFMRSNPDAQGNSLKNYLSVKYDGLMDFPK